VAAPYLTSAGSPSKREDLHKLTLRWASHRRRLRTLADVGPRRLHRRLRYELRQLLDRQLPPQLALALARGQGPMPAWRTALTHQPIDPPVDWVSHAETAQSISFTFLNEQRWLDWPIAWNDSAWPRLWQFHLHYFDWAREWLDAALSTGQWPAEAWALEPLLEHWVVANPPGRGDGWHSYTISLRTRTWIQLFRHCPSLVTAPRLQSLWQQLCWLQAHPEHCHGGNHWLENLTALALGGLQFEGSVAHAMHRRAMGLLRRELRDQLLTDGGHQERSASYHLLMLDRLIELGELLQIRRQERPSWLLGAVESMATWATSIRLETGVFPRFNDSAADACRPLDAVLETAHSYLARASTPDPQTATRTRESLIALADTGWTLLRPGGGWELAFKCGVPCPPHLPAHAHSDLLSFDLWHHGQPVIAEVGTSIYGSGPDRQFERSSAAHNTLQLGIGPQDAINWIEPVDVWSGFRAGRKAQPHSRSHGRQGPWLWVSGSHNGYSSISAQHFRWLALRLSLHHQPVLVVVDAVSAAQCLHWRGWWHLGPGLSPSLRELDLQWHGWPVSEVGQGQTSSGYLATGFGQREPRSVVERCGRLQTGRNLLITVVFPDCNSLESSGASSDDGSLVLQDLGCIRWCWPDRSNQRSSLLIPQVWIEA